MSDTMQAFRKDKMKWVGPEESTLDIFNLMKKSKIHHLPVIEDGKTVGIISDRDVSFVDKTGNSLNLQAKHIMTPYPVVVDELTTIPHAVKLMKQNKINSILIRDSSGKISGIFTSTDALDLLIRHYQV